MVFINDFPLPPTSNNIYATIIKSGRPIRIPSKTYREYKKQIQQWRLLNLDKCREAITTLERLDEEERVLSVERYFLFHHKKLYRKDGYPKKMDVTNRIKILDDSLFEILDLDDRLIWNSREEKIEIPDNEVERVAIIIHPYREKRLSEIDAFTMF